MFFFFYVLDILEIFFHAIEIHKNLNFIYLKFCFASRRCKIIFWETREKRKFGKFNLSVIFS